LIQIGFLLDPDGRIWLSSARLGISRHHAAVEMVTGLDLVELQLRMASGEPLGEDFAEVRPVGHAIGAWVLATSGEGPLESIAHASAPAKKLRVETSCAPGASIDAIDVPLLSKVTAWAPIRHQSARALDRVLATYQAPPFGTNASNLRRALAPKSFHAGQFDVDCFATRLGAG
jgi:acetyl/propionyl-CoA carboxylase alpha subunit